MEVPDHIVPPDCMEFKVSEMDPTQMGLWSTKSIPNGTFLGPYVGDIVRDGDEKLINFRFAWEIFNLENGEYLYTINATDPTKGNWMRYVNCARYLEEQNLVSVQKDMEMFYKAIKDIEPGEELLTWYQPFKKRRKKKMRSPIKTSPKTVIVSPIKVELVEEEIQQTTDDGIILGKRQRVKKKMYDDIILMSDLIPKRRRRSKAEIMADREAAEKCESNQDQSSEGVPKKRRRRKKTSLDESGMSDVPNSHEKQTAENTSISEKTKDRKKSTEVPIFTGGANIDSPSDLESSGSSECLKQTKCDALVSKPKTTEEMRQIAEIEAGWKYPQQGQEYQFEHLIHFAFTKNGRRFYKCDVCSGIYRHTFSLKRHYLRNHINCCYLSKADLANCLVIPAQQWLDIKHANDESMLDQCMAKLESGTPLGVKYDEQMDVATPGLYRCCICNKLFDILRNLIEHTQDHPATPHLKFFGCDQCKMRFTFHQNLLRHKLVHEDSRQKVKKKKDKNPPAVMGHFNQNDIHGKPYKCRLCPMKFRYQSNLEKHHQIHTSERPFDCSICGKSFPNETNLKKHMVIHIGSSVHCKYCVQTFNHVGTLRKHIRLEHPIIHKERMLNLFENRGQGNSDPANKLRKSLKQLKKDPSQESVDEKPIKVEVCTTTVKSETKKVEDKYHNENDQQVQGHSKFRFTCVVCKKRFSAYVNMCRHRRMAHKDYKEMLMKNNETVTQGKDVTSNQKEDKTKKPLITGRSEKSILRPKETENKKIEENVTENSQESIQEFYANVASNIADNLNCYLDGGLESLNNYKSYINIDDYDTEQTEDKTDGDDTAEEEKEEVKWEDFNFPPNYNPKLIYENFQCIENKYEDEIKRESEKLDKTIFDDLAPALCTRRRSSSEWIALAEFNKNDSNHGDSPLIKDTTDKIECTDSKNSTDGEKSSVENLDDTSDNIKCSSTSSGINETEKTIDTDDNSDCSKVETCVTTQENSVTQNLDLVENKDDSRSLNDDIEDNDRSNLNQNENKQSNDSPVVLNNTESNEDGHDVERNPKTSECTGGHCETSSICNTEIAVKSFNFYRKPGDAIKHADLFLIDLQNQGKITPGQDVSAVLENRSTDSKNSISNNEKSELDPQSQTICIKSCETEHKIEVLEQKTEFSNIELLNSNDTKSDLSEIDMPDSKDSKVTPVLNDTDMTDKQLMESQLQNTSNCEIQQKSEVLEQKPELSENELLNSTDTKDSELMPILNGADVTDKHSDPVDSEIKKSDNVADCDDVIEGTKQNMNERQDRNDSTGDKESVEDTIERDVPDDCKENYDKLRDVKNVSDNCKKNEDKLRGEKNVTENFGNVKKLPVDNVEEKLDSNDGTVERSIKPDLQLVNHSKTCAGDYKLDASELMQKLVEEAQKIGSDSVKIMTENSPGKDINFPTTDEEENSSAIQIKEINKDIVCSCAEDSHETEIGEKGNIASAVNDLLNVDDKIVSAKDISNDIQKENEISMEKEESGSETSKSVLHDEKSDDTVSRGDNTDEKPKKNILVIDGSMISESSGVMSLDLFTDSDNESDDIFTGLALSKRNSMSNIDGKKLFDTGKDRYTENDPFHNYEEIEFGKNGDVYYICSVCKKHFEDLDRLLRHQWKKHPSIHCHYLQVEHGHEIECLYYSEPRNRGILGITGKALESVSERGSYNCTRCAGSFKSIDRLRIHIINCAPKVEGTESSENKPKYCKKYRKHQKIIVKSEPNSPVKMKKETANVSNDNNFSESHAKPRKQYLQNPISVKKDYIMSEKFEANPGQLTRRKKSAEMTYNPLNHIRRRELTEVLDTHQCKGCGVKFKSISLLERHVRKCDGKDKFKDLKVMKSSVNDTFHQKTKHSCLYCNRGFSYPKTLMNHYKAFCLVKKDKVSKGLLTEHDKQQEYAMMMKLKQQDEDRCFTDIPEENLLGKKGWPRGMKRKWRRKNHCWTYIKKRKPSTEDKTSKESAINGNSNLIENHESVENDSLQDAGSQSGTTPTIQVKQNTEMSVKQMSPEKQENNQVSAKKVTGNINPNGEIRQKRKYVRKKIFTFEDSKKVRKICESSNDSVQSVIDSVSKCGDLDTLPSTKNKVIRKRKNMQDVNSVEEQSSKSLQFCDNLQKKQKILIRPKVNKQTKLANGNTKIKQNTLPKKSKKGKDGNKSVQKGEWHKSVKKGEDHLTVKDPKKEAEISDGNQVPDKKIKVLFNPLKKIRIIRKELLAKVETDKVTKQNSDKPPEKKKPGPKKKVIRDRIDFVKKVDSVLQKVKEEHGIPIHNGISDQEVQKNLTKAQRLQIKKELCEIRMRLLSEAEIIRLNIENSKSPVKASKGESVKKLLAKNKQGSTVQKVNESQSNKDAATQKVNDSQSNNKDAATQSNSSDTNDTVMKNTCVKENNIVQENLLKDFPKKNLADKNHDDSIQKLTENLKNHIDSIKKTTFKVEGKTSVTLSQKKVIISKKNRSPSVQDDGVKTTPKKKNISSVVQKGTSQTQTQDVHEETANVKKNIPTNNQDNKSLNSNSPTTNMTCLKKDDGSLIKKRIPIYNQDIAVSKSSNGSSIKTKELSRSSSSKTIFLKPVDSTLKKKLELAGHIQSKSFQNENNDLKIVQWNTGTMKSTGKQSSDTL